MNEALSAPHQLIPNAGSQEQSGKNVLLAQVTLAFCCLYFPVYFGLGPTPMRSVIYITPLLLLAEGLYFQQAYARKPLLLMATLYLCTYMVYAVATPETGVKEGLFLFLSLLFATVVFRTPRWFPWGVTLSGALIVIMLMMTGDGTVLSGLSLEGSQTASESSFGLAIALVTIWAYYKKQNTLCIVSFLIVFLMFKRISILALMLTFAFDYARWGPLSNKISDKMVTVLRYVFLLFCIFMGLNSVGALDWFVEFLDARYGLIISADSLSSGRHFATGIFVIKLWSETNFWTFIFGQGPGYSTYTLATTTEIMDKHFPLLHNDFLRMFSDYGVLGLVTAVVAGVKSLNGNRLLSAFSVYTLVLFLTDNVLTYLYYWIVFIALIKIEPSKE